MADEELLEEERSGGGGGKLGLLIGLINLLGLIGLAAYLFFFAKPDPADQAQLEEQALKEELSPGKREQAKAPGPMMEFGTLVINLREPTGDRYLKIKLQLELDSEGTRKEIEARLSQARYQLTLLLSGQRVADVQGPAAMEGLRRAMTRRLNALLSEGRVINVWPDEWIVQ